MAIPSDSGEKKTEPIQEPVTPKGQNTEAAQGGREIIPQAHTETEDATKD